MPTTIPIACNLDASERPKRELLLASLGESLFAINAEGRVAQMRFPSDCRAQLEEFILAESGCCPFFDFKVTDVPEGVELDVRAPEDGEWAVRGLVAGFVAGWGGLL